MSMKKDETLYTKELTPSRRNIVCFQVLNSNCFISVILGTIILRPNDFYNQQTNIKFRNNKMFVSR